MAIRAITDVPTASTRLAHARAALDRAVRAAYAWNNPDPATVPEMRRS